MICDERLQRDFWNVGPDINTVRQAMGHASVLTTQKYDKRDQSVVNEAMRDVDL